ncbi:MAG TPA: 23S rRNA (uracil(1939)-C(5))-methyltransferase RlmD [Acidobacteriaceae bacterium]|nr:23S rRNA (uracil(1939)-C(5))-methyltransferase RlmD [Acidobacteriaceae bacterium]
MKLRVEKVVYGGDGLARDGGKTIFIPGTLPGERVEASLTTDRRSFATSELEAVLEASPQRIAPACEYVPRCGGCHYQHANVAFQLQMKLDILKETLMRAHVPVPDELTTLAGPGWAYRNRIRLHVMRGALGYRQRGSHRLLPVSHCPIAAPVLEQAMAAVSRIRNIESLCEEVEFFTNGQQNQLLVSLWTGAKQRSNERDLEKFAEELGTELPVLTGVGLFLPQSVLHWGQRSLTYYLAEVSYQVSLGSFFQVNRFLLPELVAWVVAEERGRLAWDLYSGVGLFARALEFENVIAVESDGYSSGDLKKNLEGKKHRLVRSETLEFLRSHTATEEKPELIVVDPPRAGLGKEVCGHLAEIAAAKIIYISCDPATLARDLQALLQSGYFISKMRLVDLFPQTFHMETVVFLRRN